MPRRPGSTDPLHIPDGFWDSDAHLAVLKARDFARLFALVNACGNSQTRIGIACEMSQGQLSDIMLGKTHVTDMDMYERTARGLRLPNTARHELGLADLDGDPFGQRPAPAEQTSKPAPTTTHQAKPSEDLASLTVIPDQLTAHVRASPADGQEGPADTVAVSTTREWARMLRRTFVITPVALAALQFAAERHLEDPDDPLDSNLTIGMLRIAEAYRRSYQAVPASRLLPAATAHLDLVLSLQPSRRPDHDRTPLVAAAGEMAALAGVLLALDASRHGEAAPYFDFAWSAARSTKSVELQAVVLASRSFAVAYGTGDHRAGLAHADLAARLASTGASPQTRAWTAAVASERAASLGDLAGCQRRLDQSRAALTSTDFEQTRWQGIGGYDSQKLRAYEGGNMVRLRRYGAAEAILTEALSSLNPAMSRHRATALLDRADAHLGIGDIDAACDDATNALGLVTHVQHTGHLERIEAITKRGLPSGARSALDLHDRLQLVRVDNGLPITERQP